MHIDIKTQRSHNENGRHQSLICVFKSDGLHNLTNQLNNLLRMSKQVLLCSIYCVHTEAQILNKSISEQCLSMFMATSSVIHKAIWISVCFCGAFWNSPRTHDIVRICRHPTHLHRLTAVTRTHWIYREIVTTQPLWVDPECLHFLFSFLKSEISPHPHNPPLWL